MRRFARFAGGAVAAAVLMLLVPLPASAGGPTSVLLVSPGRQATASLYTTDEAYERLLRLVGENPAADPAAPKLDGGPGSDAVTVTWLIHDVQVWRVDRIVTGAEGGPWIETRLVRDGTSTFDQPGVPHKASDPKELIALLSALRLLGSTPVPDAKGPRAPAAMEVSQPVATVAAERPAASITWLWLIVGAAAGATLVVGFRPVARRLRPR